VVEKQKELVGKMTKSKDVGNAKVTLVCWNCKKKIKVAEEELKWSRWIRCKCGGQAHEPSYDPNSFVKNRNNGSNWQ